MARMTDDDAIAVGLSLLTLARANDWGPVDAILAALDKEGTEDVILTFMALANSLIDTFADEAGRDHLEVFREWLLQIAEDR